MRHSSYLSNLSCVVMVTGYTGVYLFVFRFRCVHDTRSADELSPVCWSQTQGAAQETAGDVLRQVSVKPC